MAIFFLFLGLLAIIFGANGLLSKKLSLSKEAFYYYPIGNILGAILGEKVPKFIFSGIVKNIIGLLFVLAGLAFIYEAYFIHKTGIPPI